jgi:hypothetical protein
MRARLALHAIDERLDDGVLVHLCYSPGSRH